MKVHSEVVKDDLQKRLRRIEGQVRGVQRMVADERECAEIIQQLNAIHSAVRNATHTFMREYAKDCLLQAREQENEGEELVDELLDLMAKVR